VLAEVAGEHPPKDIIAAADAVADHDGHGAAAIEAFDDWAWAGVARVRAKRRVAIPSLP
jgi:hypothetical protein